MDNEKKLFIKFSKNCLLGIYEVMNSNLQLIKIEEYKISLILFHYKK